MLRLCPQVQGLFPICSTDTWRAICQNAGAPEGASIFNHPSFFALQTIDFITCLKRPDENFYHPF